MNLRRFHFPMAVTLGSAATAAAAPVRPAVAARTSLPDGTNLLIIEPEWIRLTLLLGAVCVGLLMRARRLRNSRNA